jgi:hypothetical protein
MKTPHEIASEFGTADLGDVRLNRRLSQVAAVMAEDPARSFPQALSPSELEAAYRLFRNDRVTLDGVVEGHFEETVLRSLESDDVVVIHDTSEFRFPGETRRNLGTLGTKGQGFLAHVALVATAQKRDPLGVVHIETWTRTAETVTKKKRRGALTHAEARRSDQREALRWGRGVVQVEERLGEHPSVIHLMDSEADDYSLLTTLHQGGFRFVIRACYDRIVESKEAKQKLYEVGSQTTVIAERQIDASPRKRPVGGNKEKRRAERQGRSAKLSISAAKLRLRRPKNRAVDDSPQWLPVHVVYVRELEAPADVEPIEWTLLTMEPIDDAEALLRVVDLYRTRWLIEEYFKALKTGCAMEARQLESLETLLVAFGIFVPIAWRLLRMRSLSRHPEPISAQLVLSPLQIALLRQHRRAKLTGEEPTVRDALMAVARLGGHLKSNGDPGWIILCRGYTSLLNLEEGYLLARDGPSRCDQS